MFNFDDQFKIGEQGELEVFNAFQLANLGTLRETNLELQRMGIDGHIEFDGSWYSVEIKTDHKATISGNMFLETRIISPSPNGNRIELGYLPKTRAQLLAYYLPQRKYIGVYNMLAIKRNGMALENHYKKVSVHNVAWHSEGILVPLPKIHSMAFMFGVNLDGTIVETK